MRTPTRGRALVAARRTLLALGAVALCALPALGAAAPRSATQPKAMTHPKAPTKPPAELAAEALELEQLGAYAQAAELLQELRRHVPSDADLELALALDEARAGHLDSAATRLWGPVLSAAVHDTLPLSRRHDYAWRRDALWINGAFDGWHWYVARARAEVAAGLGRWADAREAARLCVEARPLVGKEWLVLAVCAGRAGDPAEAAEAARQAVFLDPSLPEAHYLHGIHEWRARRLAAAQSSFRASVALDSSYRPPAFALVRSRFPSVVPDTLPSQALTGTREIGLLTSTARPKIEEFVQMDSPPAPLEGVRPQVPDSLRGTFDAGQLTLGVLVDERGRIALHDLPWLQPSQFPAAAVSAIAAALPKFRFEPARRFGAPHRAWTVLVLTLNP